MKNAKVGDMVICKVNSLCMRKDDANKIAGLNLNERYKILRVYNHHNKNYIQIYVATFVNPLLLYAERFKLCRGIKLYTRIL